MAFYSVNVGPATPFSSFGILPFPYSIFVRLV